MQARNTEISTKKHCYDEFGFRLQGVLRRKGILQKDFATQLGMSVSRVSNWCQGNNLPSGIHRTRIAQFLDVDPDWLFEGRLEPENRNREIKNVPDEASALSGGKRLLMRPADKRSMVAISPDFQRHPSEGGSKRPTRAEIEYYLVSYLDRAEAYPLGDGLSIAYFQIINNLRIGDFAGPDQPKGKL